MSFSRLNGKLMIAFDTYSVITTGFGKVTPF